MTASRPIDPQRLATAKQSFETAVAAHRAGQFEAAETQYAEVHRLLPDHPGALHGLGSLALHGGRTEDSAALLSRAARLAPRNGGIRSDLGRAYLQLGRYDAAAAEFEAAVALRPGDIDALTGLGDALSILGQLDAARSAFDRALAADPRSAAGHFGLGNIAMQTGRTADARAAFESAIALNPATPRYHRAFAETSRFTAGDSRLAGLEELARRVTTLRDDESVELHFALAKAFDDLGRYDDAFAHLEKGNAIRRQRMPYDEAAVATFFREITEAFSAARITAGGGAGNPSRLPVFIVGMPRSGSSLVEQMLASHPAVFGAGEVLLMNDIAAAVPNYPAGIAQTGADVLASLGQQYVERLQALAPGTARIVDKLPPNFRHLGLIHLMLPNARIIHVHRDPVATCFSCYSKLFLGGLNFTNELGELGRYHKIYAALMAHWRRVLPGHALLDVRYETLVADFETEARRIVDFIGLDWDPRCLDFANTQRPVRTLSQAQVRQPLFTSSVAHWRHYEKHLGPLIAALR